MEQDFTMNTIRQDLAVMINKSDEFFNQYNHDLALLGQDNSIKQKAVEVQTSVNMLVETKQSSAAVQALASLGALNAQLSKLTALFNLQSTVQQVGQAVSSAWNNLQTYLQSLVQSLSTQLLQLISSMFTPTEWSVSGDTGVNLFGLSGTAGIEITFS
jgi:hypothetical protein